MRRCYNQKINKHTNKIINQLLRPKGATQIFLKWHHRNLDKPRMVRGQITPLEA